MEIYFDKANPKKILFSVTQLTHFERNAKFAWSLEADDDTVWSVGKVQVYCNLGNKAVASA